VRGGEEKWGGLAWDTYREDAEKWEASLLPTSFSAHTEVHLDST